MDPDQTAQMRRLVWIHASRKGIMLVLLWRGSVHGRVMSYFHFRLHGVVLSARECKADDLILGLYCYHPTEDERAKCSPETSVVNPDVSLT
jgi:hypothetical protein